jgi:rhodanese-related sulfurtransferase
MREIDIHEFGAAHADGAEVIDVREPGEYLSGHVPGARLVPMGQLAGRLSELDRNRPVYLVCASGNRSKSMAALLAHQGFDAVTVAGGTGAWIQSGRPVTTGARA